MTSFCNPHDALRHHVSGAIARGEKTAIAGQPVETYQPGVTLDLGRRDADAAFEHAIATGRLSRDPNAVNYAGRFMFMGQSKGRDLFKHSETREYLP